MKTNQLFSYVYGGILRGTILSSLLIIGGCTITDVTSTTSGSLDTVTPDITLNRFVDIRIASIQKEAAQGEGENLDALADLMGQKDRQVFSSWMHENYETLFSELERPSQLISRIETGMDRADTI